MIYVDNYLILYKYNFCFFSLNLIIDIKYGTAGWPLTPIDKRRIGGRPKAIHMPKLKKKSTWNEYSIIIKIPM